MTQPPTVPGQTAPGRSERSGRPGRSGNGWRAGAVAAHGVLVGLGLAAGVLGSFVHSVGLGPAPLGLLWAYVLTAALLAVGRLATGGRSGAVAVSVGWVVALLLLSAPRPEGDLVVTGSVVGYAWLLGGLVVCAAGVGWPTGAPAPGR